MLRPFLLYRNSKVITANQHISNAVHIHKKSFFLIHVPLCDAGNDAIKAAVESTPNRQTSLDSPSTAARKCKFPRFSIRRSFQSSNYPPLWRSIELMLSIRRFDDANVNAFRLAFRSTATRRDWEIVGKIDLSTCFWWMAIVPSADAGCVTYFRPFAWNNSAYKFNVEERVNKNKESVFWW